MPPGTPLADILARLERLEAKSAADDRRIAGQAATIERQAARIAELERQLGLNSRNSSKPPSSDGPRVPPRSLRTRSGRAPGGQAGHPPSNLAMRDIPDEVRAYRPERCARCGDRLAGRATRLERRQQVFDIPPVEAHVTEHRRYSCVCACGHRTTAPPPAGVPACPTSYGERVRAYVAYLSARHYLPVARLAELLGDLFGTRVSTGTVAAMLRGTARALTPAVALIKAHVARAAVIGSDETTLREEGERIYVWVWHSARAAYLARGPSRAAAVHQREFPGGFPGAVLVTDRLAAQLLTPAAAKQTCIPHLLRRLTGLAESAGASWWPDEMLEALAAICTHGPLGTPCDEVTRAEVTDALACALHDKYDGLLPPAEQTLWRKLRGLGGALTTCLLRGDVPADNSHAERLLRGVKVKQKVSNQFRSAHGTETFLALRSVIETALMQGVAPLQALTNPASLSF